MNSRFLVHIPWFDMPSEKKLETSPTPTNAVVYSDTTSDFKQPKKKPFFDVKFLGWSLLSFVPWAVHAKDKIRPPTTINKRLKRHAKSRGVGQNSIGGGNPIRFRPYVSKVPWHSGPRGFLSQLFPRYGHYCGPNWSSGKDNGSPIWDQRPIDWLDYCCYCHDIGYDSHDQAQLLKADLEFLECLERPKMTTQGDPHVARFYKTMCITGLKNILIPYRVHLLKLQAGGSLLNFGWLSNIKWIGWEFQKK